MTSAGRCLAAICREGVRQSIKRRLPRLDLSVSRDSPTLPGSSKEAARALHAYAKLTPHATKRGPHRKRGQARARDCPCHQLICGPPRLHEPCARDSKPDVTMINSLPILLFLLFYSLRFRDNGRETSVVLEGATVFLFGYAVLSSVLSLFGGYNHLVIVSLMATVMAAAASSQGIDFEIRSITSRMSPEAVWFLAIAAAYLCFADQRSEYLRMGADAGVYCNYAKNLIEHGGGRFDYRPLIEHDDKPDLMQSIGYFHIEDSQYHYQFFPGWPSLLALGMSIFGPSRYTYVMPVIGVLAIYWLFRLLRRWLAGRQLIAATLCLALNPLLIYFSRYTTSELFLFLVTSFTLYAFTSGPERLRRMALLAVAAAAVSHISLFLYVPLLLAFGAFAAITGSRRHHGHFLAISAIFLAHLAIGYWFSPRYYVAIFRKYRHFGLDVDFFYYPLLIGLAVLIFGLAVRRLAGSLDPKTVAKAAGILPAWVISLLLYSAWRGYQLGWTNDLAHLPTRDAYVNQGLESVVHVTILSIALASGVIFFLVFLIITLTPRLRPIRDSIDLFLVSAILPTMTFYLLILQDIRHNYYLSRYFLPVIAPFIVIYALKRIAHWRRSRFWAAVAPVLVFNLFYSTFIAITPEHSGRSQMIQGMKAVIPKGSEVFGLGQHQLVHFLFANITRYDLESKYGYLGEESRDGMETLREYVLDSDPKSPFLISDQEIPLGFSVALRRKFVLPNNRYVYWGRILYPYRATRAQEIFYLYDVLEPDEHRLLSAKEISWLSPASFWGEPGGWSNGVFSVDLPRAVGGVSRLKIETGGRFLEFCQLSQADDEVVIEVNGVSYWGTLTDKALTFDLDERTTVRTVGIRSATLVPAELGINLDRRDLGIDVVRLVLD